MYKVFLVWRNLCNPEKSCCWGWSFNSSRTRRSLDAS